MLRSLPILGCVKTQRSSAFHVFYYGVLLVIIIGSVILPVSAGFDSHVADNIDLLRSWKPPPQYADIVDGIRQQQHQRIVDRDDSGSIGNGVQLTITDLLRSNGYASDRPPASDNDEDDNVAVAENKAILPAAVLLQSSLPPSQQQQQSSQQQHNNAKRQFKDSSIGFPKTEARNMIRALINLRRYR